MVKVKQHSRTLQDIADETRRRDVADDILAKRAIDPAVRYHYHAEEIIKELKKGKPDYAAITYHRRGMSFARAMAKNIRQRRLLDAIRKKFFKK